MFFFLLGFLFLLNFAQIFNENGLWHNCNHTNKRLVWRELNSVSTMDAGHIFHGSNTWFLTEANCLGLFSYCGLYTVVCSHTVVIIYILIMFFPSKFQNLAEYFVSQFDLECRIVSLVLSDLCSWTFLWPTQPSHRTALSLKSWGRSGKWYRSHYFLGLMNHLPATAG